MITGLATALVVLSIVNLSLVGLLELNRAASDTEAAHRSIPSSCTDSPSGDTSCVWPVVSNNLAYMHFEDSLHYQLDNSSATEREWAALSPGDGIIHLQVGNNPSDIREFSPSMFHQLRCLDVLRARYAKVSSSAGGHEHGSGSSPPVAREFALTHHCLNYLRQILLCNSDLHIDPIIGADHKDADLVAHTHICRDWTDVYRALERNQRWYNSISK
ncbi:hypothetical protein PQX77_014096 [Marasmius sp. AFHP31]|nr:hypothetical protein PQX77_014096 [Marasmius sp. AFHP31]